MIPCSLEGQNNTRNSHINETRSALSLYEVAKAGRHRLAFLPKRFQSVYATALQKRHCCRPPITLVRFSRVPSQRL